VQVAVCSNNDPMSQMTCCPDRSSPRSQRTKS